MVYYLCPDYDVPSWGVGMLYYHVYFLKKNNIEVAILHEKPKFKLTWLNLDLPIVYRDKKLTLKQADVLVVPDVYIEDEFVVKAQCRKVLFVQNAYIVFERVQEISRLNRAGFEAVFYYMPHMKKVLSGFFEIPLYETPAFIADYYFSDEVNLNLKKKIILIYPKLSSRDYPIIQKLLKDKFGLPDRGILNKIISWQPKGEWEVKVIENYSHSEVAALMKEAAFFINLNTHEAFNSSVPEAMAAGCINFTYEAFGPGDFLKHKENAFVYDNNYVFELFNDLANYATNFDADVSQVELIGIRKSAYETAKQYTSASAEKAIVSVFKSHFSC